MIADNSGIGKLMPIYITFLGVFSVSSLAFPGTNSFVGEFLVLIGAFLQNKVVGFLAIPGAILAAAYMLRLLQKIVWGERGPAPVFDLNAREIITLLPLMILVFWVGFVPGPFLEVTHASVARLLEQVQAGGGVPLGGLTLSQIWHMLCSLC
jgi:NADH-quinone oxidoreductase subunit M